MTLPCLYTFVKNMAATAMFYGFLPPHGKELAVGEEMMIGGDLTTRVAMAHDQDRSFPAYEACLDDTELVIVRSPAVFLYDTSANVVQQLIMHNRVLGVAEPCWGYFSESGGDSYAGG
jgi:hypothetical protein